MFEIEKVDMEHIDRIRPPLGETDPGKRSQFPLFCGLLRDL